MLRIVSTTIINTGCDLVSTESDDVIWIVCGETMYRWIEPGIKHRMLSVTPRLLAGEEGRTEDSDIVILEDNTLKYQ